MSEGTEIRDSAAADRAALEALYRESFPEEDLLPLVRALLDRPEGVLSLVAAAGTGVAGHVVLTDCAIEGSGAKAALLGPLAVAPEWQRRGVGAALVRAGLERLEAAGVMRVLVLGDPGYYGRFGFAAEDELAPPYPLPAAWRGAWQSLGLGGAGPPGRGRLVVPGPWRRPALWGP